MIKHSLLLLCVFVGLQQIAMSQRTETVVDFSPKNSRLVFALDNDMLFSTDSYYTAGVGLSYTNKKLKKNTSSTNSYT